MSSNATLFLTGATLVLALIVPGPTNTLLFFSGAKHGIKHSLSLIGAELLGYMLAISGWCGLLYLADSFAPISLEYRPCLLCGLRRCACLPDVA